MTDKELHKSSQNPQLEVSGDIIDQSLGVIDTAEKKAEASPITAVAEPAPKEITPAEKEPVWPDIVRTSQEQIRRQLEEAQQREQSLKYAQPGDLEPDPTLGQKILEVDREIQSAQKGLVLLTQWEYALSHPEILGEIASHRQRISELRKDLEGPKAYRRSVRKETGARPRKNLPTKEMEKELKQHQEALAQFKGQVPEEFLTGKRTKLDLSTESGRMTAEAIEKLRKIQKREIVQEVKEPAAAPAVEPAQVEPGQPVIQPVEETPKIEEVKEEREEVVLTEEQRTKCEGILETINEAKAIGVIVTDEELQETLNLSGVTKEQWKEFLKERKPEERGQSGITLEEGQEEKKEELKEQVTGLAIDKTLNDLLDRYAPSEKKEGRGRVRGAIIPVIAGLLGSKLTSSIISAAKVLENAPLPALAASMAFVSSGITSAVRASLGENTFSLFSRYSHTEGKKGFWGKVVKAGQLFTRGGERAVLTRLIGLRNAPETIKELFNDQGELVIPVDLDVDRVKKLIIPEGVWYLLTTEAVNRLGAYLTDQETQEIAEWTPKVQQAVNCLYNEKISPQLPAEEETSFFSNLTDEIIARQKRTHVLSAGTLAGVGAAKAALLSGITTYLTERFINETEVASVSERGEEVEELPMILKGQEVKRPVQGMADFRMISGEDRGVKEVLPVALRIERSIGHTLVENGRPTNWTDFSYWQNLLFRNDTENPELWKTASGIARAIMANPEKTLAGLSPEAKKQALDAAESAVEVLTKAGYNSVTGVLDPEKAKLLSLSEVKAVFHWVKKGAVLYA